VNAGYVALAGALAGVASILARRRGARAWIAAGLFGLAGVVSVANALDPTLGTRRSPVEIGIVGLALGPLVVSPAPARGRSGCSPSHRPRASSHCWARRTRSAGW